MAQRKENIVMFPFMAQGHIIPFLALALQLEKTNKYTITLLVNYENMERLKSSLPQNSSIHLLEIPFNSIEHDLPPCTENTDSIPHHLFPRFLQASASLEPHFKKLISELVNEQNGQKPLCIITDSFLGWCKETAQEYGIFHAIFIGGGGFGFACFYSLWVNLPHRKTDADKFLLPDFPEASTLHVTQMSLSLRAADGSDSLSVLSKELFLQWKDADGILVNTVEELDKIGLMYFKRKFGRPVWPIGPVLLSTESRGGAGKEYGISAELCKKWLDTKPYSSVLYVSFGSQNTIAASQMMQLAMALEASGKNFIWVVRPPIGFDINSEFKAKEWLPQGFEEKIKGSGQGLVVHKWAPQVEILSHRTISAFLSHCGWNSVLEALSHGVPIIGWPLAGEQFYNSKLLEEEIGVCVEVARGLTCEVLKEDLSAKIELAMNETEKGTDLRNKAKEVKVIIKNAVRNEDNFKGPSVKAMDQFLNAALIMRQMEKGASKNEV
ncbi:UDP-glycosyltransferase 92A1 [Citrus sinensis]|uniref:UDP-glycosyltransferase 92A1 n=1 Tax=Citrus sinensis TaxID=2711 RepID=A0ACB8MUK0_CITSI|nr:UDP-glycosyltransferase 92A1 [Citrus sinensis]KAH9789558.1 UDP-glycosyltransferase 92A1 [Citrus sinensis]